LTDPLLSNVANVIEHGAKAGAVSAKDVSATAAVVSSFEGPKELLALFTRTHVLVEDPFGAHLRH